MTLRQMNQISLRKIPYFSSIFLFFPPTLCPGPQNTNLMYLSLQSYQIKLKTMEMTEYPLMTD